MDYSSTPIYQQLYQLLDEKIKAAIPDLGLLINDLPIKMVQYLLGNVGHYRWINHLTLCAIMVNEKMEIPSSKNLITSTHALFMWGNNNGFSFDRHLDPGSLFFRYHQSGQKIKTKYKAYNSLVIHTQEFLAEYPVQSPDSIVDFLLPVLTNKSIALERICKDEVEAGNESVSIQTEPVKNKITDLGAVAKLRWDWMVLLLQTLHQLKLKIKSGDLTLPYDLTLPGFDRVGKLTFRVWNKYYWVKVKAEKYSKTTVKNNNETRNPNSDEIFLQFVGEIPSNGWFLKAIEKEIIQSGNSSQDEDSFKYLRELNLPSAIFATSLNAGIISADHSSSEFFRYAKNKVDGSPSDSKIIFQPDSLISAALFGCLAVLIISLTGVRMAELQQLNLESSFGKIIHPIFDELNNKWDSEGGVAHVVSVYVKGQVDPQPSYCPDLVIDMIKVLKTVYKHFHDEKIQPISACQDDKQFSLTRYFQDKKYSFLFQWKGRHLANKTINNCIYFILLEYPVFDEAGKVVRLSAHKYRHGFAGYLRQKGVPLDRIARLLHHVNSLVAEHYAKEPEQQVMDQIISIITDVGSELKLNFGQVRNIDDIRRFEEECYKRFGPLRKIIGGKCGVYCSCEAMNMCLQCVNFYPTKEKRHELIALIDGHEKAASYFDHMGSKHRLLAQSERLYANYGRIRLAELDQWENTLFLETGCSPEESENLQSSAPITEDIIPEIFPLSTGDDDSI